MQIFRCYFPPFIFVPSFGPFGGREPLRGEMFTSSLWPGASAKVPSGPPPPQKSGLCLPHRAFFLLHMKEVWRGSSQDWPAEPQTRGQIAHAFSLSSLAVRFLLLVLSGCWSSSLHVCIPGSRQGKGMHLATSSALHITHISLGRNYTPLMGRKARIWSLLSGRSAQALLLQGEKALDIQSHLTASATHLFALMPSLFFPVQKLTKIVAYLPLIPRHVFAQFFLSHEKVNFFLF